MGLERLCLLDDLPEGAGKEFLVSGKIVAVFRLEQQVFALDGMCAHQGGPIAQGQVQNNCVTCPWHGWQYNLHNGNNLLTGKQMLATYQTAMVGDEIWIDVDPSVS